MMNVVECLLLVTCSLVAICKAKQDSNLPLYVDVCYRDDPQVTKCIKKAIEKIVPILKGGSRDFELDPLDPQDFRNLTFTYHSPLLGGTMTVPLAVIHGLTNLQVLDVRLYYPTSEKLLMEFDIFLPRISTQTDYELEGNVLYNDVQMNGHIDIDFENLTLTYYLEGNVQKINKKDYLSLKSFYWRLNGDGIQGLYLLNEDVVEGRPYLSRVVASTVRSAWQPLMSQIVPAILPRTDASLRNMFTKFFKKYPYDVLFPKRKA